MVGVLQEAGVDLHLAHSTFRSSGMSSHAGILQGGPSAQKGRDLTPSLLLARERPPRAARPQPWSRLPLYFADHSSGTWARRRAFVTRREIGGVVVGRVAHQRLLLPDPIHRLMVMSCEAVACSGVLALDGRALVDRWSTGHFSPRTSVEVLEPAAAAGPRVEGAAAGSFPPGTSRPSELGGRIPFSVLGGRSAGVRRALAPEGRHLEGIPRPSPPSGGFGPTHATASAGSTQLCRVKPENLSPPPNRRRRMALRMRRAAEAGVVDEHDQDVCPRNGFFRELRGRILGVPRDPPVSQGSGIGLASHALRLWGRGTGLSFAWLRRRLSGRRHRLPPGFAVHSCPPTSVGRIRMLDPAVCR